MNSPRRDLYDISPPVLPGIPVWPGDSDYLVQWQFLIAAGGSVNVSQLHLSPHTGAHADAFHHCADDGAGIGEMPIEPYLGPARVIELPGVEPITRARLEAVAWQGAARLLFRTRTDRPANPFQPPFAHLTTEVVQLFGEAGVKLVGLDTPSVDEFHSRGLECHQLLRQWKIANLEHLDLSEVPAGDYELIALPLKLMGIDASPVRAVLRR